MMQRRYLAILLVAMAGCAATPMRQDVHPQLISQQEQRLQVSRRCCSELVTMSSIPLRSSAEVMIDERMPIARVSGLPAPTVLLELSDSGGGRTFQFFSFGDRKRGLIRLDKVTFIRPIFAFLDADRALMGPPLEPPLCWGALPSGGGVWTRLAIPADAKYVAISPSIAKSTQYVDTRAYDPGALDHMGVGGKAAVEAISEARGSYLSQVSFGYEGLVHASLVASSATPLGRCIDNDS